MKEGHSAYLACSSVIMEELVEGHLIWFHGVACHKAGPKNHQHILKQKRERKLEGKEDLT